MTHDLKIWPEFFGPVAIGCREEEFKKLEADNKKLRAAIRMVLSGTEDTKPPFRSLGTISSRVREILRDALSSHAPSTSEE